jgi:small subunit ribosomal protein S6
MPHYETGIILAPDQDEGALEERVSRVQDLVAAQGGAVVDVERWGTRRLAYTIKGHRQGQYVFVGFDAPPATVAELERTYRVDEAILRHLTIRLNRPRKPTAEAAAKAETAAKASAGTEEALESVGVAEAESESAQEETPAPDAGAPPPEPGTTEAGGEANAEEKA